MERRKARYFVIVSTEVGAVPFLDAEFDNKREAAACVAVWLTQPGAEVQCIRGNRLEITSQTAAVLK